MHFLYGCSQIATVQELVIGTMKGFLSHNTVDVDMKSKIDKIVYNIIYFSIKFVLLNNYDTHAAIACLIIRRIKQYTKN